MFAYEKWITMSLLPSLQLHGQFSLIIHKCLNNFQRVWSGDHTVCQGWCQQRVGKKFCPVLTASLTKWNSCSQCHCKFFCYKRTNTHTTIINIITICSLFFFFYDKLFAVALPFSWSSFLWRVKSKGTTCPGHYKNSQSFRIDCSESIFIEIAVWIKYMYILFNLTTYTYHSSS